jgi:hypothetical protein
MAQNGKKNRNHVLLLALACGAGPEAAARQAGLSARTVYRRLADPVFKAEMRKLQADMVHRNMGSLIAMYGEAARGLLELVKPTAPPAVRLGAIRTVLEFGIRLRQAVDLEERLEELETLHAEGQRGSV